MVVDVDRPEKPSIYIEGWMTDQINQGRRPDYRVPSHGLPKVPAGFVMEIETSFMAAARLRT